MMAPESFVQVEKSILLQTLASLSESVLYVTGEESLAQVAGRATRLGLSLGSSRMFEYSRRFGFGERTGVPWLGHPIEEIESLDAVE